MVSNLLLLNVLPIRIICSVSHDIDSVARVVKSQTLCSDAVIAHQYSASTKSDLHLKKKYFSCHVVDFSTRLAFSMSAVRLSDSFLLSVWIDSCIVYEDYIR